MTVVLRYISPMAHKVRIYTRTGDRGATSLYGGKRVDKNDRRVEAYGTCDELNSLIGMIVAECSGDIKPKLLRIQNEIFVLGTDLATPFEVKIKVPRITSSHAKRLEKEIDLWDKNLPQLKNFILPGGSKISAMLHLARARCRCLERILVSLDRTDSLNRQILAYINRLSDWFFVLARHTNFEAKSEEIVWRGRG